MEETRAFPRASPPGLTSVLLSGCTRIHPSLQITSPPHVHLVLISTLSLLCPEKAPESSVLRSAYLTASHCDSAPSLPSVCLSVSLSSQASPGLPHAVQWGPYFSPHRGGCSEHGARGARQEAGDHGEAGRGKASGHPTPITGRGHTCTVGTLESQADLPRERNPDLTLKCSCQEPTLIHMALPGREHCAHVYTYVCMNRRYV